jgi:putative thioredoxin
MTDTPYAFDVNAATFQQYVIENSFKVPVLVDFWAEWCAPCKSLKPVMENLAAEYDGQFLLAKIDTDAEQELAQQFGVRSLPTVKVFKDGQAVDEFMGAQPESVIRELLEKHVERESDKLYTEAISILEQGQPEAAAAILEKAREMDPGNRRVTLAAANLHLTQGEAEKAQALLNELPYEMRQEDEVKAMAAKINIALATANAPDIETLRQEIEKDPANLTARLQLANQSVAMGDFETGMNEFLEIMKRDRSFHEDAGRNGLINCFEMLGGQGELVSTYRRKMTSLMY